jgi:plastocyanin
MRYYLLTAALGALALGFGMTPVTEAQPPVRRPYNANYYGPNTWYYSPSGTHVYVPYTSTYTPTTNFYFAPSYSLPSMSYGAGFTPPATSYNEFLPATAYSDYSAATFSANPSQSGRVDMHDNYFSPSTLTIRPGTTVRWVNFGQGDHTTTSDDNLWSSGELRPGGDYRATFHRQGTYHYRCKLHGREMQGVVIVQ